jgi:ParB family chromosome partitioning protein
MGHARALLGLSDSAQIISLASRIAKEKLSVRDAEQWVRRGRGGARGGTRAREEKQNPHVRQVVEQLQQILGTKVRLIEKGGQGRLEIDFFSHQELDRLLALLRK